MGQLSCKMRLHVHVAAIATLQCINEAFLKEVHIQHHPFESTPDGPAFLSEEKQSRSSLHLLIQTMWDGVVVGEPEDLGVFLHERVYLVGVFQSIHHHKQHCVVVD